MTARKLRVFEDKINVFMEKFAWKEESRELFQARYPYIDAAEVARLFQLSREIEQEAYKLLRPYFQAAISAQLAREEAKEVLVTRYLYLREKSFDSALWRAWRQLQHEALWAYARQSFYFLETEYGYRLVEERASALGDFRDAEISLRYAGSRVGVEIAWSIGNSLVGVNFVECLQEGMYPHRAFALPVKGGQEVARLISLYDLAGMQDSGQDPDFLLRKRDDYTMWREHARIIEQQMPEVLAGLARATRKYAASLLQGDTIIFEQVMDYRVRKQAELHFK